MQALGITDQDNGGVHHAPSGDHCRDQPLRRRHGADVGRTGVRGGKPVAVEPVYVDHDDGH